MEVNNEEKMISKCLVSLKISFFLGSSLFKIIIFLLVQYLVHFVLNTYYPPGKSICGHHSIKKISSY